MRRKLSLSPVSSAVAPVPSAAEERERFVQERARFIEELDEFMWQHGSLYARLFGERTRALRPSNPKERERVALERGRMRWITAFLSLYGNLLAQRVRGQMQLVLAEAPEGFCFTRAEVMRAGGLEASLYTLPLQEFARARATISTTLNEFVGQGLLTSAKDSEMFRLTTLGVELYALTTAGQAYDQGVLRGCPSRDRTILVSTRLRRASRLIIAVPPPERRRLILPRIAAA